MTMRWFTCLTVLALAGCRVGPEPAGYSCSNDSECATGLKCFAGVGTPGGGCLFPTVGQCGQACTTNADCAGLTLPPGAARFVCEPVCSGQDAGTSSYCRSEN